jgi:hypothetical protein
MVFTNLINEMRSYLIKMELKFNLCFPYEKRSTQRHTKGWRPCEDGGRETVVMHYKPRHAEKVQELPGARRLGETFFARPSEEAWPY